MLKLNARKHHGSGFTLIEVLIGILIFAVGMMALAKLQGNLARNSGDSNARTVATNIAEEFIERARVFQKIDSGGGIIAYNDIVDFNLDGTEPPIERSGNMFTVTTDVTDYYYNAGTKKFDPLEEPPAGIGKSDFKQIDLTVTWNTGQEFQVDGVNTTNGRLGSGSIRITDVVSSMPSGSGGKAGLGSAGDSSYAPPVNYNPGSKPDIVSISLGANKFKESTKPLPNVIRTDELVETTFDVVTYSQVGDDALFLRREEFKAVSCECTLKAPANTTEGGLRPTIWEGYDYTEGELISKPYGVSANNQQSEFCDICCRDHHDGGSGGVNDSGADPGRSLYNPFRSSGDYIAGDTLVGDHKHYTRDLATGVLDIAEVGETYLEACRMIRKDGFFRIAQDLRQEGLNAFPAGYLDVGLDGVSVGASAYSGYVTGAVSLYENATDPGSLSLNPTNPYENSPPALPAPRDLSVTFPASNQAIPFYLPDRVSGATEQQLRSRGIYLDYMSDVLRARINCMDRLPVDGSGADCKLPQISSALEIIPFYDVQLTWLTRWNESPSNYPIDVTNQVIKSNNAHSRGIAKLTSGSDSATISSTVHTGNLGLTGTDPIDPLYEEDSYYLYARANDDGSLPELSYVFVSGTITSAVNGVKASDVEIVAAGAQCERTNTGFVCNLEVGLQQSQRWIKFFGYSKGNRLLTACSLNGALLNRQNDVDTNDWTKFILPISGSTEANVVIKEGGC